MFSAAGTTGSYRAGCLARQAGDAWNRRLPGAPQVLNETAL